MLEYFSLTVAVVPCDGAFAFEIFGDTSKLVIPPFACDNMVTII